MIWLSDFQRNYSKNLLFHVILGHKRKQNHSVHTFEMSKKCSKIMIWTFFKLLQKCSRSVQEAWNRSGSVIWASEQVFLPPDMFRNHFCTFLKNRLSDLKIHFSDLSHAEAWKVVFSSAVVPQKCTPEWSAEPHKTREVKIMIISANVSYEFWIWCLLFGKSTLEWLTCSVFLTNSCFLS